MTVTTPVLPPGGCCARSEGPFGEPQPAATRSGSGDARPGLRNGPLLELVAVDHAGQIAQPAAFTDDRRDHGCDGEEQTKLHEFTHLLPPLEPDILESLRRTPVELGSAAVVTAACRKVALGDPRGGAMAGR